MMCEKFTTSVLERGEITAECGNPTWVDPLSQCNILQAEIAEIVAGITECGDEPRASIPGS